MSLQTLPRESVLLRISIIQYDGGVACSVGGGRGGVNCTVESV